MKIYVATDGEHDDYSVTHVFSNKDAAEKYKNSGLQSEVREYIEFDVANEYQLKDHETLIFKQSQQGYKPYECCILLDKEGQFEENNGYGSGNWNINKCIIFTDPLTIKWEGVIFAKNNNHYRNIITKIQKLIKKQSFTYWLRKAEFFDEILKGIK